MRDRSGLTLISMLIVIIMLALVASMILVQIDAQDHETELSEALLVFKKIQHAARNYLRRTGAPLLDLWTSDKNPCNPNPPPGKLKWSDLRLEDPHTTHGKWYYTLYIEKTRSFSIGAISKDCTSRFFEVVHAEGNSDWNCDANAGMRPFKEKDGRVTGCTYL